MAFRLRPDESIPHGLRRLARKELGSAAEQLRGKTPRDEAIHEARKSLKKTRAIFALIDADDGRGLNGSSKRLRSVNRALSHLRDADAMLTILDTLRKDAPAVISASVAARVRARLSSHKKAVTEAAAQDAALKDAARLLRKLRRSARRWRPGHRGFSALAAGLRRSHRRGRKARARALERGRAQDFHEWRKEMKALRYELRLLERSAPQIRRDAGALHRAESWLGDEHNVVILCEELAKDASLCGSAEDLDRIRLAADRYQCSLRKKAAAAVERVYARKSRDYLRGIERAWKAWRKA